MSARPIGLATIRPGCWNKPRPKKGDVYYVLDRVYLKDGSGRFYLEDRPVVYDFTEECHHDGLYSDCSGCIHRKLAVNAKEKD